MTNGEFVSRVRNDINALTKDQHVSGKWILNIGIQKAESYISQQFDKGNIFGEESLFTVVECVPMINIQTIDCCVESFRLCKTLMRDRKSVV